MSVRFCPQCESTDVEEEQLFRGRAEGLGGKAGGGYVVVCNNCGYQAPEFPEKTSEEARNEPLPEEEWHDVEQQDITQGLDAQQNNRILMAGFSKILGPLGLLFALLAIIGGNASARNLGLYILPLSLWMLGYGFKTEVFHQNRLLAYTPWMALVYWIGGVWALIHFGLI
ncbi:MAG: hypothetical protein SVU32_07095 [Candidatus Nanohaloarchaea archaeon]|nr:hypothetical protein [Candidatus Nanohaloarchaea archaeon]